MRYQRILWLEDNPEIFSRLPQYARALQLSLDQRDLLSRVTLAYDFDQGAEIVRARDFDLYVLDGDFPNAVPDARRAYLDACMAQLHRGDGVMPSFDDGRHNPSMLANNFARFWEGPLQRRTGNVVVFSISDDAIYHACRREIPFYKKGIQERRSAVMG